MKLDTLIRRLQMARHDYVMNHGTEPKVCDLEVGKEWNQFKMKLAGRVKKNEQRQPVQAKGPFSEVCFNL